MAEILLQTCDLTKKYGDFSALDKVSLTLKCGDIYGLIGRNGAGKTTFFKCVMGLAKPSGGSIAITGTSSRLGDARRRIGFMINPAFFPYLNPRENLKYLCRVKHVQPKGEIERLLKLVQLEGVKKPFKTFSLGMKQRLGLAGALLGRPPIIVLDEPINGLDPQGIADMRGVIQRENQTKGTTFIVSSHILSELDLVATRFGFIEHGRLLQELDHTDLHERTRKSLVIETNDVYGAREFLQGRFGVVGSITGEGRLLLESHFDQPQVIARALFEAGFELSRLAPQETTLEEYFMRLVGSSHA
ncbi:MAG: ABC transporter ATP-binding protein [Coriobacteriales bacterium]|jgi:ABC-2 type transport system ATP-binding protein|nr:ABC transporter ATP-binding protein [Coriobacteriales bacterium]